MKRRIQIYIEPIFESGNFQELELFNDETIEVTSSVQNISDISKVLTDVSLSFSVPATPNNNAIFQHFYNSDIDSTIDQNLRRNAFIEIDLTPFRTGKINLEKANVKRGLADSYQITFYGDLLSLKDKFGEDKLSDVKEINNYSHVYSGTEIYNRITDNSIFYDVRYPLISWKNLWQYGTGSGSWDITMNAHAITYNELFPALSVRRLMQAIGTKYGITFSGSWMSDQRFIRCFLLLKNVTEKKFITETTDIDFNYTDDTSGKYFDISNTSQYPNSLFLQYISASDVGLSGVVTNFSAEHKVVVVITTSSTDTWYIDTYSNGVYQNTVSGIGTDTSFILSRNNVDGIDEHLTFKVRANATMTLTVQVAYTFVYSALVGGAPVSNSGGYIADTPSFTLIGNVDLATLAPEIKVADFVSGILKEFNLTCYSTSKDNFTIQPLDEWYSQGAIVDITKSDIESIEVERIKLYKKIAFKYQESESFMNKNFKSLYYREYGNTELGFNYDGEEYTIEVPFENLMFNKFSGTDLQVGYHLTETFNSYVPKPTLLYMYDQKPCSFKFYNGSTHVTISDYMPFGQDMIYQNTNHSLNFSADTSTLLEQPIANSLFGEYYFGYLTNLYNLKNRLISVKTNLPISLLTNLKMNDRIIIRDKRYIINQMKSNLLTGDVDFSLYLDFRPIRPEQIISENTNAAVCNTYLIDLPNGCTSATLSSVTSGVTFGTNPVTSDSFVNICIPANGTGVERTITILISYLFRDGSTASNSIYIIQPA